MISIRQRAPVRARVHPQTLRRRGTRLLTMMGVEGAELSVLLTDDAEIRTLNAQWRGKDLPTDVLSFPQEDGPRPPGVPRTLGDVVISLETAERQRLRGALPRLRDTLGGDPGWSLADEVTFLLLHGVLHLLGHDHVEPDETAAMEALEAELLPRLVRGRR